MSPRSLVVLTICHSRHREIEQPCADGNRSGGLEYRCLAAPDPARDARAGSGHVGESSRVRIRPSSESITIGIHRRRRRYSWMPSSSLLKSNVSSLTFFNTRGSWLFTKSRSFDALQPPNFETTRDRSLGRSALNVLFPTSAAKAACA